MPDQVVVTYLEMSSRSELSSGSPPPLPMELRRYVLPLSPQDAQLLRDVYRRVGAPHDWNNSHWSDAQWDRWLNRDERARWLAFVEGRSAGIIDIEAHGGGDVEIKNFGLVPEFIGRNLGGHLLTLGVRLAWELQHADGVLTSRVWLHTQSSDHDHALANYVARGFKAFKTETVPPPTVSKSLRSLSAQ